MVDVCVLSVRPPGRIWEGRQDEALQGRDLGSSIDDSLQLLGLMVGSPDIEGLVFGSLALVGRITIQTPKVTDSEDSVSILEGQRQCVSRIHVGLDNLCATGS